MTAVYRQSVREAILNRETNFYKKEHEKTPDFRREMLVLIRFSDWQ
jgi:hypothetical protein